MELGEVESVVREAERSGDIMGVRRSVTDEEQTEDPWTWGPIPEEAGRSHLRSVATECARCSGQSTGDDACPFTTLYWDFLLRHEKFLAKNQRMTMQLKNLGRLDAPKRKAIQQQATQFRAACRPTGAAVWKPMTPEANGLRLGSCKI